MVPTARQPPSCHLRPTSVLRNCSRHLSVLEKPCSHANGFTHLRRWLQHCSARAIGFCKAGKMARSLSDNHRKSTCPKRLIDPGHNQIADCTLQKPAKLRKHYCQWSRFNIIGKCLPKCYLIAWLPLFISPWIFHVTVPQTNKSQLWQRLLISYLWCLSLHNCACPFCYATPKVQREISVCEVSHLKINHLMR